MSIPLVPTIISADKLFRATVQLGLLPQTDADALREDLENLAPDLMVELIKSPEPAS